MTELFVYLAIIVVLIPVLMNSIRIAEESERFAVFVMGRFQEFKGPGLILITPYAHRVCRLKVGDVGVLKSSEFATFRSVDIPVSNVDALRPGQAVKIEGFDGAVPRLVASSVPAKTMCPNCGHQF